MKPNSPLKRLSLNARSSRKQAGDFSARAEKQLEQYLFKRGARFSHVRRFVISWIGLLLVIAIGLIIQTLNLSNYYQTLHNVPGGIYNEGILGRFTTANPLYATSDADSAVSHLIFAGLLKYNTQGKLVGDLASSYQSDDHGISYAIHLRPNLKWQDGQPLTSADVAFTYRLIQNPDTQSPLQASWQFIKISTPDPRTIIFTLPGTLASFPYNLTTGIVPEHILSKIPASDLRSADFNSVNPVGAGPFSWQGVQVSSVNGNDDTQEQVALKPFKAYEGGKPKLQQMVVRTYASQQQLIKAFDSGQLTAIEGLDQTPRSYTHKPSVMRHDLTLRAANMVFFKTASGVLADSVVRHSLVQAANVPAILTQLSYPARAVNEPFLTGQIGYDPSLAQPKTDVKAAISALAGDGWAAKNEILMKDGRPLAFTLSAADTPDNHTVADALKKQWSSIGVKMNVDYLDTVDFQNAINYHSYDAVLDGISIGQDPDVFVYWDSSQADVRSANRLNLSEYKSSTADASLEAGRSRLDPSIRAIKYKPFLQAWQQDSPALGLYQPRDLYLTNGPVAGLSDNAITTLTDRYANVQNWEIRQAKVTN